MPSDELTQTGEHVMTVCNACRYCEQYCPVFPAMEERSSFGRSDLNYLANLCHNCGECLYACQYAPPHEFGIDVPRTLAAIRVRSYEEYSWPAGAAALVRRGGVAGALATVVVCAAVCAVVAALTGAGAGAAAGAGDFYAVVPHHVLVALFGVVFGAAAVSISVAVRSFWRDVSAGVGTTSATVIGRALRDAAGLRHLHGSGIDCPSEEQVRTPWRRLFHHATFYGFLLCLASTTVAAVYHAAFGWQAPHAYLSVPVVLGTVGGVGLLVGPAGLLVIRARRDPALQVPAAHDEMDRAFIVLLLVVSATGLGLLAVRTTPMMQAALVIHLGSVLALGLLLPYGKFVHGFHRTAALLVSAMEQARHEARTAGHGG